MSSENAAKAGSILQLTGLTVVGLGLLHGLATDQIGREIAALGLGGGLFLVGWLVAKRGPWQS